MEDRLTRRSARFAVLALAAVLAITAAWWGLAFWPDAASPPWLLRTRTACFGTSDTGLPDAGGWILLVGQPLSMLGFLHIVWGGAVVRGLRELAGHAAGRSVLAAVPLMVALGLLGVAWRVAGARVRFAEEPPSPGVVTATPRPRAAPRLELTDQDGEVFRLDRVRGRPAIVTFAWAHCETVCPLVIQDVQAARARVPEANAALVVVTLDPWRDTPRRLPSMARQWHLGPGDFVLGGNIESVLETLDAWDVSIRRDERTGAIDHTALVYILDGEGRIAFTAMGGAETITRLLGRV